MTRFRNCLFRRHNYQRICDFLKRWPTEKTVRAGFIFRPYIFIFDRIPDIADESKTVRHFFKLENVNMQFFIMEIKTLFCGKCLNAFFSIF